MSKKWYIVYGLIAAGAVASYVLTRGFLIDTYVPLITLSNLTFNLLLFTMAWGGLGPWMFRERPFIVRWGLTLAGFVLIIVLLTVTGTHTRLTDLF